MDVSQRMDAYQLYQKYSESNTWVPTPEDYDTNNIKLVALVLKMQEERPELPDIACSIDKLTQQIISLHIDIDTKQLPEQKSAASDDEELLSKSETVQQENKEITDADTEDDDTTEDADTTDEEELLSNTETDQQENKEMLSDTELLEELLSNTETDQQENKEMLSDPETIQRNPHRTAKVQTEKENGAIQRNPHRTAKVQTEKENGAIYTCAQARTLCNTLMVGKSKSRIKCIADTLHANVPINWVHTFASKVIGATQPQLYRTLRNTDSHIHVISGSVLHFLSQCDQADKEYTQAANNVPTKNNIPTNITTFAWGEGNDTAIHIQKFNQRIREIFKGVSVSIAIMFIGSIGLPLHELFKPRDYIQRFQKGRFKFLNSDNIVKSTLRKFIKIKKISPDIEAAQLLQQYSNDEQLFETIIPASSVEQYLFKHWYSYPKHNELQNILVIAQQLLDLWRTGQQNRTE